MKKELYTLMILNMLTAVGYSLMTPLYPQIASLHDLPDSIIGIVFASFSIANVAFIPFSPYLFSKFSKKHLFNFALVIESLSTITFGLLSYISNQKAFVIVSIIARFSQGIGSGCSSTIIYSLAVYYSEENSIKKSIGMMELGLSMGLSLGPIIGSFLAYFLGFECPFYLLGCLRFLCLFAIRKLEYIESPSKKTNFIKILFRRKIFLTFIAMITNLASVNFFYPVLSNHLQETFDIQIELSSIFFVIQVLSYFVFINTIGKINSILGGKMTMSLGLFINFFSLLFLSPATFLPQNIITVVIGLSIMGLTEALISIPALEDFISTMNDVLKIDSGISNDYASALFNLGVNLGDSIGPIIGGYGTEKKGFELTCLGMAFINIIVFALFISGNLYMIDNQLSVIVGTKAINEIDNKDQEKNLNDNNDSESQVNFNNNNKETEVYQTSLSRKLESA